VLLLCLCELDAEDLLETPKPGPTIRRQRRAAQHAKLGTPPSSESSGLMGVDSSPKKRVAKRMSCSCLASTKESLKLESLLRVLRQWNIQVPRNSCCALHAHITECQGVLQMLKKRCACEDPDTFANRMGDSQCNRCGMLSFHDTQVPAAGACAWCSSLHNSVLLPGIPANLSQKSPLSPKRQ